MKLKISICDDDKLFLKDIQQFVNIFSFQNNIGVDTDCYHSGTELLAAVDSGKSYDIYFMDIELSESNGINIARQLLDKLHKKTYIIFISNYPNYMQDSFSVHPYYFFQKPVSETDISNILSEILLELNASDPFIAIEDVCEIKHIVHIHDIIFLESINSKKKRIMMHTKKGDFEINGKISDWTSKLRSYSFINCYRGIIINLDYVHYICKGIVKLQTGDSLPISRGKEQTIQKLYVNQIIRK